MDFQFTASDQALRDEAQAFVRREWNPGHWDVMGSMAPLPNWHHADEELDEHLKAYRKKIVAQGWYTMHWPEEHGGKAIGITTQLAYREAMAYAGSPSDLGGGLVAPVLMVEGAEWMRKEFLPKIANADIEFSQGFSEPDAGSDLAGLKTRAERDGDDYIINGQKIWGTYRNDWIHILVRTDPDAPKHRGITYLLMPLKDESGEYIPGVTVRGINSAVGRHRWDELFMENVRVPSRYIIGEENRGWYAAMTTLSFERSGIQRPARLTKLLEDYIEFNRTNVRRHGPSAGPLGSTTFKNRLAELRIQVETLRMLAYRVAWMQSQGMVPQRESSMTKFLGDETAKAVYRTLYSALGEYGNLLPGNDIPLPEGGYLNAQAFMVGTLSVAGGTTEIQKGIIAQRGLGLPR
jgi:alkylation response protein AidB-like acyl-CoA dehydrogenase